MPRSPESPSDLIPTVTAAEMRAWERTCFVDRGLSERVVMESAGRAVAQLVANEIPEGRVVGYVGRGNNGGDAIVALRTLRALGRDVVAVCVGGDGVVAELAHGWEIPTATDERGVPEGGVILDGILGTGASGPLREPAASAVGRINAAGRAIVAIDGPTGVDLSTGAVEGDAVHADLTVTFGALKRGLVIHPGREYAGRIVLAEVGFPPLPELDVATAAVVSDRWAADHRPRLSLGAHKGAVGLVGVVAGRQGYGGAPILVAMGALRAGSGGVRIFSPEANRIAIHAALPEAVFVEREGPDRDSALGGVRAVVVGPGIGFDDSAAGVLKSILASFSGGIVLDADALTLISRGAIELPRGVADRCVLTPHPGELARLLGTETSAVVADRFAAAHQAAERFDCTVLAKGAPSIVAHPSLPTLIAVSGHSGVATGGMGDTLGGIIGAFLAGGASPREAAAAGLHYAGRAAEAAGRGRGLLPRDVAEALPGVLTGAPVPARPEPVFLFDLPAPS